MNKRTAFTLIELLTTIAIIGLLVGLLLPAVQAARESGRRTVCANKVKQLGLAVHTYEATTRTLPPVGNWSYNGIERGTTGFDAAAAGPERTWNAEILPYIEMQSLNARLDPTKDLASNSTSAAYPTSNRALLEFQEMPFQACPSNPYALGCRRRNQDGQPHTGFHPWTASPAYPNWAVSCYAVCAGPTTMGSDFKMDCPSWDSYCLPPYASRWQYRSQLASANPGMFGLEAPFRCQPGHVRDGLSNTLMICERNGELTHHGGVWSGRKQGVPTGLRINSPLITFDTWNDFEDNSGASSHHAGGATFCFGDGAVRFLSDAIDFDVYNLLGRRNDGKVVVIP